MYGSHRPRRWLLTTAAAIALIASSANACGAQATKERSVKKILKVARSCPGCWVPPLRTSFQLQFTGTLDTTVDADLYDLDGFDTSAVTVGQLHAAGRRVVCYMNAGAYEDWRPDASQYTAAVLGQPLDDWPGERWVDVRDVNRAGSALARILRARIELCKMKGFDTIEFDNVDGYTHRTGFPLTANDQLTFNIWLANEAHLRGMSAALKNDLDQVPELVAHFDWALDEQCHQYDECDKLLPFIRAGKAVMQVEYQGDNAQICAAANARNFNALKKRLSLDAFRVACR